MMRFNGRRYQPQSLKENCLKTISKHIKRGEIDSLKLGKILIPEDLRSEIVARIDNTSFYDAYTKRTKAIMQFIGQDEPTRAKFFKRCIDLYSFVSLKFNGQVLYPSEIKELGESRTLEHLTIIKERLTLQDLENLVSSKTLKNLKITQVEAFNEIAEIRNLVKNTSMELYENAMRERVSKGKSRLLIFRKKEKENDLE